MILSAINQVSHHGGHVVLAFLGQPHRLQLVLLRILPPFLDQDTIPKVLRYYLIFVSTKRGKLHWFHLLQSISKTRFTEN